MHYFGGIIGFVNLGEGYNQFYWDPIRLKQYLIRVYSYKDKLTYFVSSNLLNYSIKYCKIFTINKGFSKVHLETKKLQIFSANQVQIIF